jgi:3-ketosteroid 9alpha-monooxygenase subunit B
VGSLSQVDSNIIQSDDPRHQFHDIVVAEVIRETADASSFVFDIPETLRDVFEYKPGQFLTFEIPWQDFSIKRCYSLSSSPGWDEKPKVTIKRVDDGRMSNWMNENLTAGDRIRIMPPAGQFVLHEHGARPLFLFGGGSGITPILSLLKQALGKTTRPVKMVYANRDADSIIFKEELDRIAEQHSARLQLVHHLDNQSGFLSSADIKSAIADHLDADIYICGPTPFMDTIEEALKQSALKGGEVHVERFVSAVDPDREEAPAEDAPPATGVPTQIVVHLDGNRREVDYVEGETLLKASIRAGLDVPYSCQDGYCSCCMARIKRGKVSMKSREALTNSEIEEGWILTCQAKPTSSECEIEYED